MQQLIENFENFIFFAFNPFHMAFWIVVLVAIHITRLKTQINGHIAKRFNTIARIITYSLLAAVFIVFGLQGIDVLFFRSMARLLLLGVIVTEIGYYQDTVFYWIDRLRAMVE